jgi:hypothetical protein
LVYLHWLVAIQLTKEAGAILNRSLCQLLDEVFDRFAAGFSQGGGTAIMGGIGLHKACIELVLADQQAETIAKARLTVGMAVASVRGRSGLIRSIGPWRVRRPPKLLYRAKPNAISFTEGPIDCASLSDAHLGAVDYGRDIGGISVTVADEALRTAGRKDSRLKDPSSNAGIAQSFLKDWADSKASAPESDSEKPGVGYVPFSIQQK